MCSYNSKSIEVLETKVSLHIYLTTLTKKQYVEVCKQQQIASGTKVLLVIYNTKTG